MGRLGYFIGGTVVGGIGATLVQLFSTSDEIFAIEDNSSTDSDITSDDAELDVTENSDM